MTSSVKPGSWHISPLDLSDRLHPSTDPSLQWTALVGRAAEFSYRCFVFFSADHFWVLKALVRVGRHVAQTQCVFPSAETCSTFIQHPHQQAVLNSSAGFPPFMLKLHVWQSPRLLRCGKKVGNTSVLTRSLFQCTSWSRWPGQSCRSLFLASARLGGGRLKGPGEKLCDQL